MVSPAVYPRYVVIMILAIFTNTIVDPLNLESQNQAKNIPVIFPSSPIKI